MPADKAAVGARLREEREERGWSRETLARHLRNVGEKLPGVVSLAHMIKEWEAGKHGVSDRYQVLYASVFGIPRAVLFGEPVGVSPWRIPGSALTLDDEARLVSAVARPARIDADVVQALATILAGQRRLEDAIGPAALLTPVGSQTRIITGLLREASGPHRVGLGRVVAEWVTFFGWLHAATRQDAAALTLFGQAEELADEVGYGAIAAQATSFRGYVARQQGRHRAVVRAAAAAAATPGGHPAQRTYDVLQEAQARAILGERDTVRRMLDEAAHLADEISDLPSFGYWYTTPFFRLNIGLAQLELGEYRDAAALISTGMAGLPPEQRRAEWVKEYESALADATDRA